MTVGLKIRSVISEVGTSTFLTAFFSTISHHLETEGWGTRYPVIMNKLYRGKLEATDAAAALQELELITAELAKLPPDKVVWDYTNSKVKPPWGDRISPQITDLSNYFVTSTGRDLIALIKENLEYLQESDGAIEIVSF